MRCFAFIFSAGHFLAISKRRSFRQLVSTKVSLCSSMASRTKPPNVLVYSGESNDSLFNNTAKNLLSVLHPDKYVVYELTKSQVLVQPWKENIALLVVVSETIEESTVEIFRNYLAKDGKMLVFCSNFTMPEIGLSCMTSKEEYTNIKYSGKADVDVYRGKVLYNFLNAEVLAVDSNNVPVVMKATCNEGVLVVSAVHLVLDPEVLSMDGPKVPDNKTGRLLVLQGILSEVLGLEVGSLSIPVLSPGFVLVKENAEVVEKLIGREVFVDKGDQSRKVLLMSIDEAPDSVQFDKRVYFSKLGSKVFGNVTVFFPVTTSTMRAAEHLSDLEGAVVIAARQTCGCGRGGNQWISPEGCAMFTLHLTLSLPSQLGQRLSVLQHMASLAAVLGVRNLPGYDKLDLHLKWPNDIYYGKDQKIGGVLINTTIQGSLVHAYIGIGVNVANENPTFCIDSIIKAYNEESGDALPLLPTEVVIARTLTELEILVDDFMTSGPEKFLSLYYLYWLHSNQCIMLDSLKKEVTVKGLDEFGFLIIKTGDGKTLRLQPDGNRFDMMQNLIVSK